MMKFCQLCNNLMYPRENRRMGVKELEYYCKQSDCSYTEPSPSSSCVYVNDIVKDST